METLHDLTLKQFRAVLKKCSGKRIALDTETTGLRWWADKVITIGFHCPAADVEGTIDIGYEVDEEDTSTEVVTFSTQLRQAIKDCLQPGTTVIMHNSKFDAGFMEVAPVTFNGWKVLDTPIMIHLMDSRHKKSLEWAEKQFLGSNSKRSHITQAPTTSKTNKKGESKRVTKRVWLWPSNIRQDYCVNDARVTYQLAEVLLPQLEKRNQMQLFRKEMNYLKLIYKTEHIGILIDPEFVGRAATALQQHTVLLAQQLFDAIGYEFNWRSSQQLSKALYADMGIEMPKDPFAFRQGQGSDEYIDEDGFHRQRITKGGQYNKTNTSTFILMEKVHHPLGELVSSIRESYKLAKTLNTWLQLMDENCVIHTDFNLTGTRTGRLSSKKPPVQNIPSDVRGRFTQGVFTGGITRKEEYNLRNGLIARPGYMFLSIDYKTMEMNFFAQTSGDEALLAFIREGKDIHGSIALKVWGDCGRELNKIHREWSKTIAFSLLYGMTTGSLQHKLSMTFAEAKKLTDDYWTTFPRIRPWLRERMFECRDFGFVTYWSGRRWLEEVENFYYRGANAVVQGGCADLLSVAALRCDKWLKSQNDCGNIVSYIHDEILFEIRRECLEDCADHLSEIMQVPDVMGLPFKTECKVGSSYGNLEPMQKIEGKWKMIDKKEVY